VQPILHVDWLHPRLANGSRTTPECTSSYGGGVATVWKTKSLKERYGCQGRIVTSVVEAGCRGSASRRLSVLHKVLDLRPGTGGRTELGAGISS
jgi:hypothetical protein